jgi:two-component system copper resistance phosphate regulon response regulator CusR
MKILLIEDEAPIAAVIKKGLEKAHFSVDVAHDGDEGLVRALDGGYALILLDLMLPKRDGWSVCQALRARRDRTPILMLTARDAVSDRVRGLEMGADDYLPKPFAFSELLARVRAQVRRDGPYRARLLKLRDVEIDTVARRVTRAGTEVALTPREYTLLEALAVHEGEPLRRETILERVWMDPDGAASNVVDVHINTLRRKIDSGADQRLIHTVHGVGYVMRSPDDAIENELPPANDGDGADAPEERL